MPALPSIYSPFDSRYQNPMFNQQTGSYGAPAGGVSGGAGTNAASALPGATAFGYTPQAGGIPQVPNPVTTAGQAIAGNQGNLGNLGQLATGVGKINAGLGALPYQQNLPNYSGLLGQASGNALANLQGKVPQDVINQIQQAGAERGIATGSPGGPNANAAYLRALGLTSLGQQQTGLSQFGNLMGLTPTGPAFNPASMFVDPTAQQQAQAAANLYNSAPIPQYAQNAAMAALQSGLNQGRGQTQPQSQNPALDTIGSIIGKYAPTVGGTPSPAAPAGSGQGYGGVPGGPGTMFNDLTGEYQDTDPLAGILGGTSGGDVTTGNATDPSSPDYWNFDNLYPSQDTSSFDATQYDPNSDYFANADFGGGF